MRPRRGDNLFELFPDLPRPRRGSSDGFLIRLARHVETARARTRANAIKQRAHSRRVQALISSRRRG